MFNNSKLNIVFKTKILILSSLLLLSTLSNADSKVINIGSDPWCPYVCLIDDNHQGLMVDIAREALALSNFRLNFKIINWARAKESVKTGKLDGIIGMTLEKDTATQYYFSNTKLAESQTCFYKRANDEWEYKSVASLENRTFGWINNYGYSDKPLHKWILEQKSTEQVITIAGIDTYSRLFKLLALKRIDTFAEDRNVIAFEAKKSTKENELQIAGCLTNIDNVHLAFSLKAKQKAVWANALDTGVAALRKTGRIDELLSFYGLSQKSWLDSH
jgi:polar amino acid transport system substrate-binding protein